MALILIILKAKINVFHLYLFICHNSISVTKISWKGYVASLPYVRYVSSGKALLVLQTAYLNAQHGIFLEEL